MRTKIVTLFFILIFSQISFCQKSTEENKIKNDNSLNEYSKDLQYHLVSQMDYKNLKSSSTEDFYRNGDISVNQIGDYNKSILKIAVSSVAIDILQNGSRNEFDLNKNTNTLMQRVVQEGHNNSIRDLSTYNPAGYDINMEFIQKGNNQSIQNYGVNSISKDMTVIQKGNGASVLIINHK